MSSNRRILFFSTTSSPVGGVETWLDRACEYLSARGFDPMVGLARGQKYNVPEHFRKYHPNLNTIEVDGRGLDREGRIRALMRCIRQVQPTCVLPMSVVDANDAVMRCKLRGDDVRLIIHAQGNLPRMLADLRDYRDGIDAVVCPGRLTRRMLIDWAKFPAARVSHIPNGADLPVKPQTISTGGPIRLGYIGRFTRGDKRALDLIEFQRLLSETNVPYELTVVGDGPCRDELESALACAEQVRFLGPLAHDEVYRRVFPELDALVLFSSSEAFGIVLAEAMMHGVVPVTSEYVGYHSEKLVVNGDTGLSFPVGDMAEAVRRVEMLSQDRTLWTRLSQAAMRHAHSNYTWERSLSRWRQVLEDVSESEPLRSTPPGRSTADSEQGRLVRFGTPAGAVDALRRMRRFLLGPAVPPGGEEWPLFHRTHHPAVLEEITVACQRLETSEATCAMASEGYICSTD